MPRSLPTELLVLVASFAPHSALASLALVSTTAYAVSARFLYTSIAPTSVVRATKCLRTLSLNTQLAELVHIFTIKNIIEKPREHDLFSHLVAHALENMVNLTELSLQLLCASCSSTVLKRATFKLHKLVCVVASDAGYPVSRFLESQPAIESLYLVCHHEGLISLSSTALPALRDITAPIFLLRYLLPTRLEHISRISSLSSIRTQDEIWELDAIFRHAPTRPVCDASVELVLGLDLRSVPENMEIITSLAALGYCAPWVGSLRLEIHHGRVDQEMLMRLVTIPHHFPALHTFIITSQSQPQHNKHAYTQPQSTPDLLHDATRLRVYLCVLHIVRPSIERVIFPIGMYEYVRGTAKEEGTGGQHYGTECTSVDCPTLWEVLRMSEDRWIPVPESTLLLQTIS